MILTLLLLFIVYLYVCSEFSWKGGLIFTIIVGFLQDPIRKLSPVDSSYFGAISLAFFIMTFLVLRNRHRLWYLGYLCWNNQNLASLIPLFLYVLLFQSLNSFARFGDIRITVVGLLFYLVPLISLWVGFHIGTDTITLRRFMIAYFVSCAVCAISVFLSAQGVQNFMFKEVGLGIDITGVGTGNSGFWRTAEIAGWNLAAGACFGFILGMTETKTIQQGLYFFLSISLTYLSTLTGRRKALAMVVAFVSLYLIYYTFTIKSNKIVRSLTTFFLIALLALSTYGLLFNTEVQSDLGRFEERTSSITVEETQGRFTLQGIGAFLRGLEIAGPLGLGVGAGTNVGNTGISISVDGRGLGYVSEGGGGRVAAELGFVGGAFLAYLLFNLGLLYYRNFQLGRKLLPAEDFSELVGLLIFVVTNMLMFFSAAQLYSDPFVLIIIGLSAGTFLAIPILVSKVQNTQVTRKIASRTL